MTHTKTTIRSAISRLVNDRERCMNIGAIARTMPRVNACTILKRELEWTRKHGHNAHTALVRRNADYIRLLAGTILAKVALREELFTMVSDLNNQTHDKNIQTKKASQLI